MNILYVKSIEFINIFCVRCGFRRSLPFQACFAVTVIPVIQRSMSKCAALTSSHNRNKSELGTLTV